MEKLIYKFTKGKKTDFDALMVADYEPQVLSEDVYNDDNKG
jgi:HAE1 family hydrophobic/amphiphilic exporter-1